MTPRNDRVVGCELSSEREESELLSRMCVELNTWLTERQESIIVHGAGPVPDSFNAISDCTSRQYIYYMPCNYFNHSRDHSSLIDIDRVNNLLACFVGSHSFHNYTEQKNRDSCTRTIYSIGLVPEEPILCLNSSSDASSHGTRSTFLQIRLHGSGFMKHQIRRMMGIIVWLLVKKSDWDEERQASFISWTLDSNTDTRIPMAPPQYLLMEDWLYDNKCLSSLNNLKQANTRKYLNNIRDAVGKSVLSKDNFPSTIVYNDTWLQPGPTRFE